MIKTPAICDERDLLFGRAPKPVTCGHGVVVGGGSVLPEINFTLPPMEINQDSWQMVREQYREMITGICDRAVDLQCPEFVVEFELLPPMTHRPEWGAEITSMIRETLEHYHERYGLKSALRVTVVDIRDNERPPRMRSGAFLEKMLECFDLCAGSGADLLSIESTGGKELHDVALLNGDLTGIIFALGVLGATDMKFLWDEIVKIAQAHNVIAAGDTACGFANTVMVLAERKMLPRTLAAVVRVASVPRSLVAFLRGAKGPAKDCGYENPYIKVLMGVPISMEGRSSACAHLSPLGNIASACADLWSNESVQNVRLLSGPAPVASLEQLIYDCRLMNEALREGDDAVRTLRRWLVESDAPRDPQAWVLRPDVVVEISRRMAECSSPLEMTLCGAEEAVSTICRARDAGSLKIPERKARWLDMLSDVLVTIPRDTDALWESVKAAHPEVGIIPSEYLLNESSMTH